MLDNCCYNYSKILYKSSKLAWFLKKHALSDCESAKHDFCKNCVESYRALLKDLEKHLDELTKSVSS